MLLKSAHTHPRQRHSPLSCTDHHLKRDTEIDMLQSRYGVSSRARPGDHSTDSNSSSSSSSSRTGSTELSSSRHWVQNKLSMLQLHLELDQDLTRFQPPQVPVVNHDDGNVRIVLLTTAELFWQHQAIEASFCCTGGVAPSALCSNNLQGSDFRVSDRYRCLADHRGQVQGGVGFIYEGIDLVEGSKVAVKFFHKTNDDTAMARINIELMTCVRLYHGLHATRIDQVDEQDLLHLAKLRDVVVDAPIFEDGGGATGLVHTAFRATAMVFDWADGGDAHAFVRARGGVTPAEGTRLFQQLLRGLRALHRRGIVHRDIKPENILLLHESRSACLCDFGFAKHVASVQPADLVGDPTTCYQSPERWLACHGPSAALARSREPAGDRFDSENGFGGSSGCGVSRRDETRSNLYASDVFSAGVTLFLLVGYHAILTRLVTDPACGDVHESSESGLPALNVFQHAAGSDMFDLLQAGPRARVQGRLWAYWEVYGLRLPSALRGLLDGVLHPMPEWRFSIEQAFAWIDSHPEMFSIGEQEGF